MIGLLWMRRLILAWVVLSCIALLGACSPAGLAGAVLGGPKVAANVQAGKVNAQTVGQTSIQDNRIIRPQAERIEQSTGPQNVRADRVERVVVNEVPPWIALVALLGWLLPTPGQMAAGVSAMFGRLVARLQRKGQVHAD